MVKPIKLFILAFLIISFAGCNKTDQNTNKRIDQKNTSSGEIMESSGKKTESIKEDIKTTVSKKSYTDLTEFWNDFKKFALSGEYGKITEMTYFPFLYQSTEMSKTDFKEFRFTDTFLDGMKTKKAPMRSEMMFMGIKSGEMYEVEYDGQAIYFAKKNDEWRFVGILFGE